MNKLLFLVAGGLMLAGGAYLMMASPAYASLPPGNDTTGEGDMPSDPTRGTNGPHTTSASGIAFIKQQEGLRLTAYPDANGYSIGYGHFGAIKGQTITLTQAEQYFSDDLRTAENTVNSLVDVPLTQGEFDALVDFVYNVGASHFRTSSVLRYVNEQNFDAVPDAMRLYNMSGGAFNQNLADRRNGEIGLWYG